MLKKLSLFFVILMTLIIMTACTSNIGDTKISDTPKTLVTIDQEKITQQDLDLAMINSYLSEKEIIENLIDNRLFLSYSKDLKVKVTKREINDEINKAKSFFEEIDNDTSVDAVKSKSDFEKLLKTLDLTKKEYWDSYAFNAYKKAITIGKTKEKLGNNLTDKLQELRNKYEIKYYD